VVHTQRVQPRLQGVAEAPIASSRPSSMGVLQSLPFHQPVSVPFDPLLPVPCFGVDDPLAASVADEEASFPVTCPVRIDGQVVPVIPKPKRVAKKPTALSSPPAPRLLRKTPAHQARASSLVSK
jgi:hypothetical protein